MVEPASHQTVEIYPAGGWLAVVPVAVPGNLMGSRREFLIAKDSDKLSEAIVDAKRDPFFLWQTEADHRLAVEGVGVVLGEAEI